MACDNRCIGDDVFPAPCGTCEGRKPSTMATSSNPSVDDLAMLIKQLVRHLKKASPTDTLSDKAMDYLKRYNLQGSPLRNHS